MLTCSGVGISFGGIAALTDVDLMVHPGEIVGLIGPNGSGKTTLVNVVTGYYRAMKGTVEFEGESIRGRPPYEIRRRGVSRVFQNLRLYGELTVIENLELGMLEGFDTGTRMAGSVLRGLLSWRDKRVASSSRERAWDLLAASGLTGLCRQKVAELSYGQRKEIELLRAIAIPPRLLLLDEPTSGVSDREAEFFKEWIGHWQEEFHFGVMIVEHRLRWLFDMATRVVALNEGHVIASGSPADVAGDSEVRRAYVGG